MAPIVIHESLQILAHPLGGGSWRVSFGASHDSEGATIGYIEELGGTYEVRGIETSTVATYAATFKHAMECFHAQERPS